MIKDMTNDLAFTMLEVIDEMSPILELKPNVRLHRNSPEKTAGQGGRYDRRESGGALPL